MQKEISSLNRELKEKEEFHIAELKDNKRIAQEELLCAFSNWEREKELIWKALSDIVITTFPMNQIKEQKWGTPQSNTSSILDLIKNMKRVFQQMLQELRTENQEAKININLTTKRCTEAELKFQKLQESLPMDLQYDKVKIKNEGECTVFTVEEAERLGFRRAYKWHEV